MISQKNDTRVVFLQKRWFEKAIWAKTTRVSFLQCSSGYICLCSIPYVSCTTVRTCHAQENSCHHRYIFQSRGTLVFARINDPFAVFFCLKMAFEIVKNGPSSFDQMWKTLGFQPLIWRFTNLISKIGLWRLQYETRNLGSRKRFVVVLSSANWAP